MGVQSHLPISKYHLTPNFSNIWQLLPFSFFQLSPIKMFWLAKIFKLWLFKCDRFKEKWKLWKNFDHDFVNKNSLQKDKHTQPQNISQKDLSKHRIYKATTLICLGSLLIMKNYAITLTRGNYETWGRQRFFMFL